MRTGIDVVSIERISALLARRRGFLARVFTDREITDSLRGGVAISSATAAARLAARFAAKEAARKALDKALSWHDVEVRTGEDGSPTLWVRGDRAPASLSLAHDGGIAVALVIAEQGTPPRPRGDPQQGPGRATAAPGGVGVSPARRERSRPATQKEG